MGLSGKVFGAGLGWLVGGPIGAVIGGILGHYVKDAPMTDGAQIGGENPEVRRQREEFYFVANLVGILALMVKVDGKVTEGEVQAVRRFFSERLGYRGESLDIVKNLLKQSLDADLNVEALCLDFRNRSDYSVRILLMECLHDVAHADGHLHPEEERFMERVATLLGVEARDWRRGEGGASASSATASTRDDYEILGIPHGSGQALVKSAYRELVKKYHPDRVAHLGDEFKELAHQKFLEIQQAYDRLTAR